MNPYRSKTVAIHGHHLVQKGDPMSIDNSVVRAALQRSQNLLRTLFNDSRAVLETHAICNQVHREGKQLYNLALAA